MIRCTNCNQPYPEQGAPYLCSRCGGLFDEDQVLPFDPATVDASQPGIWRYRAAFGLPAETPAVSLGEGQTPLVWTEAFGRRAAVKCEFQNPTGSFKDRGSAVIAGFLRGRGVAQALEDSSGNAGASFAAYAARAGIRARIFVPDSASGPKRAQIEAYGAQVTRIMGPRANAAEAARRAAAQGEVYASHAHLPFNLPGYATLAYELVEQLGAAPGAVILPAGQGGLLLGLYRGFLALQAAGQIASIPRIVGVQARACAPLWALQRFGPAGFEMAFKSADAPTLAEGIRVQHPARGDLILRLLAAHGGLLHAVEEEAILPGKAALAQRGFYVEPTSAVVWDAVAAVGAELPDPLVLVLTGSGLKTS